METPRTKVLFYIKGKRQNYLGVRSSDGQYKIVESDSKTGKIRSHHISRESINRILDIPDTDQYEAAAELFHRQRLVKKARRLNRETGVKNGSVVSDN